MQIVCNEYKVILFTLLVHPHQVKKNTKSTLAVSGAKYTIKPCLFAQTVAARMLEKP